MDFGNKRRGFFITLDVSVALMLMLLVIAIVYYYMAGAKPESISGALMQNYLQDSATVMAKQGYFSAPLDSTDNSNTSGIRSVLAATPPSVCMQVTAYGTNVPYGLLAYWKLDEGAGSFAADSSGNSHFGTLHNAAQFIEEGKSQAAVRFNSSAGNISAAGSASLSPSDVSVSAWVKLESSPSADKVIARMENGYWLGVDSSGKPFFKTYSGAWNIATGTTTLQPGRWYHLAGTADWNGNTTIYVNGIAERSQSLVAINYGAGAFAISSSSAAEAPNASIDEVRIYGRVLSPSEMRQLYSNPSGILYTVNKPGCPYSASEIYTLTVPFSRMAGQEESSYRAVLKAWLKGERNEPVTCIIDGQACANNNDCCENFCNLKGTCGCISDRSGCSIDTDCCSGLCNAGVCNCKPDIAACNFSSECCGGFCNSYDTCGCVAAASGCFATSDCCSGLICNSTGKCAACMAGGFACGANGDCCSGLICNSTGKCAACLADGFACGANGDCCGNLCNSGSTCGCLGEGSGCSADTDCCIGWCNESNRCSSTCIPHSHLCSLSMPCCAGWCFAGTCGCASINYNCAQNSDCCSGICSNSTWRCAQIPLYGKCDIDNPYDEWQCEGTTPQTGGGVQGRACYFGYCCDIYSYCPPLGRGPTQSCVLPGASCVSASDCCWANSTCSGGLCSCQTAGDDCYYGTDCCSGTCVQGSSGYKCT